MSARRDLYAAVMAGGPHSPQRSEKASELIDAFAAEVRSEVADDVHRAELPRFAASESPELAAKVVRAVDVRLAAQGPQAPYGVTREAAQLADAVARVGALPAPAGPHVTVTETPDGGKNLTFTSGGDL